MEKGPDSSWLPKPRSSSRRTEPDLTLAHCTEKRQPREMKSASLGATLGRLQSLRESPGAEAWSFLFERRNADEC